MAGTHVLSEPTQLCRQGTPFAARTCRRAEDVESLLARDDLEILAASETSVGVQGAYVLTLRSGGVVFRAKWRPHASTTRRNSPRFELAAYAVQKLFLEPREYVVPPTVAQCFPLEAYRARVDATARATFEGAGCVYGVLSYWLEDVESIRDAQLAGSLHGQHDHAFDPELFDRDRTYKDSIARVNAFTYVIGHRDSHARNFVITRAAAGARDRSVYSVDNSLSFTMAPNPRIAREHDWSKIRVPALPRAVIERLREADRKLAGLRTIASLRRAHGRLVTATAPEDPGGAGRDGIAWSGDRLAVGLTADEIAGVRTRIHELLDRVDRGTLALY